MTGTARSDFRPLPACPAGTQVLKLFKPSSTRSLPWQEAKFRSVAHVSSCKTFRSGWTSQPGRPRVRVRWLTTNLPLVPGKLARGEINCCRKIFRQIAICRAPQDGVSTHRTCRATDAEAAKVDPEDVKQQQRHHHQNHAPGIRRSRQHH